MRNYTYLWLAITLWLSFEYWALSSNPSLSFIRALIMSSQSMRELNLSTEPGRPISYFLGYTGFGLILLTNLYILRKKLDSWKKYGTLPGWLNFHIFCGLLGPTCIVFHSGFKVRGLVAISFWSMIIVAVSGVIGRYIYVQLLKQEKSLVATVTKWSDKLTKMRLEEGGSVTDSDIEEAKVEALRFMGVPRDFPDVALSNLQILLGAILGDMRLLFDAPAPVMGLPERSRYILVGYAVAQRQIYFLEPFRRMLGYWHAFHLPFAIFMYIAAVIHIISALMFGISG